MTALYICYRDQRHYAGHWPSELDAALEALKYYGQGATHAVAGSVQVPLRNIVWGD